MRKTVIILSFFLSFASAFGQTFEANSEFNEAYGHLLNLEFDKGHKVIRSIESQKPDNIAATYLHDLSDFLQIVVSEDQRLFSNRKELRSERLKAAASLPDSSPYKLLCEGEIHLHWAFSMMRFGEYLNGAREINKAFHALEINMEQHPNFIPTYKSMGLLHTLIGTVPDNYKWATKLMGVDGTIEQGIAEMEKVIQLSEGRPDLINQRKETLFLLSFLHINLLNDKKGLLRYQELVESENGPLMDFTRASLLIESGQTDKAIGVLSQSNGVVFPYLNFLLGEMKLARMDADADLKLKEYVDTFKGNSYLKASYQKLAWHALLVKNNESLYRSWIAKVDDVGNTMLDEDKAAQKEYESGQIPNKTLLKARLQFDGGYLTGALKTLVSSNSTDLKTEDERLEFTYRLARIHHALGNNNEAISYYKLTIEQGKQSKRYFAANASLMLGLLHEQLGRKTEAIKAFEACGEFINSEYRNSINQKAKAGILRLKN
jgi:tetratricopeptide (TPR) repeat protein